MAGMVNVTLRALSMPDAEAWGEALRDGARDAAPAVAETLREAADSCFETSTDPWGNPWAPLKDATIAERERLGKVGKILIRDGTLRTSVFGIVEQDGDNAWASVGAGGPAAAYAMVHQHGSEDGTTPPRPFLPVRGDTVDLPAALDAEVQATIRDAIDARVAIAMRLDIAAEE